MHSKTFNAKILLFGEYTIINGAHALAIPVSQFNGTWAFADKDQANILQLELDNFTEYLDELRRKEDILRDLDLQKFKQQLSEGLYFKSNIPQGYGVGSSGALCAAVFSQFSKEINLGKEKISITDLKNKFAQMESFFHGSSSGIDPLVSFLNNPILIENNKISEVRLPSSSNSNGAVFLLDTGIKRKTEPLVKLFLEKCKDDRFVKKCNESLTLFNEKAIQQFLNGNWESLLKMVHQISLFQFENFNEMIPKGFISVWKEGLSQDLFKLKLCGAGGGGFILGFTESFELTTSAIPDQKLIPIFRF